MSRPHSLPFAATLLMLMTMTATTTIATTTFVISPDGHDADAGTAERPFHSLQRARDAVRGLVAGGLEDDVKVLLRGGTYALPQGLSLTQLDSGTAEHSITWASFDGEVARLVGGVRLTDWRPHAGEISWCPLPDGIAPRRLIENGAPLGVARFPA
ncbi:MAG TPA: hypothetical protein VGN72_15220 [Tepidisphaeraceae bacterium]|jgi:hypothetical protein|nr:hypothetical protein [Tepidisphaeraceae bacterium]